MADAGTRPIFEHHRERGHAPGVDDCEKSDLHGTRNPSSEVLVELKNS